MRAARLTARSGLGGDRVIDADDWLWLGVLAVVVGSTLAYGGVTSGARAGVECGSIVLACGLALRITGQRAVPSDALRLSLPLWLLVGIGVLQLLPLPVGVRSVLGAAPEQSLRFPLVPAWLPLSLNAASTASSLFLVAAVAVLFVVSLATIRPRSAAVVAACLVGAGGVIAAASIWSFLEPGALFATVAGVGTDRARGPFVNPDHFGNWLAALVPLGVAGILTPRRLGPPGLGQYRLASAASLPFLAAALGLTFSRAALMGLCCGLAYFALGMLRGDRLRRYGGAGIGIALLSYAAWAAGATLVARFAVLWNDPLGDMRFAFWRAAGRAIMRAPLLGSGLGTFLEATRPFLDPSVPSRALVDHAHSEPLQLVTEAGAIGLAIALGGLVAWLRILRTARRTAETPGGSFLSRGAEAGVITLLVGALFDFAIRLPAVGALGVLLAALAVAAEGCPGAPRPIVRRAAVALAFGTILFGAALVPGIASSYHAAQLAADALRSGASAEDRSAPVEALDAAAQLQPRMGEYRYQSARRLAEAGYRAWTDGQDLSGLPLAADDWRAQVTQTLYVRAVNAYLDAIAADRTNPTYRRDLGWVLSNLATLEEAFASMPFTPELLLDRLPPNAEPSTLAFNMYEDAVDLEPRNANVQYTLGLWALEHLASEPERGLGLGGADQAPLEAVAAAALRRAVTLDRSLLPGAVEVVMNRGAVYEDVRALVAADQLALWQLGQALEARGRTDWVDRLVTESAALYPHSVALAEAEDLAANIARRSDRVGAQRILAQMRDAMPSSSWIAGTLARADWRLGAYADAQREFSQAIAALPPSIERNALERDQGFMLIDAGDLVVAKDYFARLLVLRPADPWLQLGSGIVLDRQDLWLDASQAYQRARALAGHDSDLYYKLGQLYYGRGLYYQAASTWEAGLQVAPKSPEMHLWLARASFKDARRDAAQQEYREVLRLRPGDREAQAELDVLLARER
ncbi:MAG: O-antigen ligase family protein [Candidatus Binatia bacterium]